MTETSEHRNALSGETSPYLLQHADNPVAWSPWSETALDRARHEDKPILLSVGYSACHWCHVMAHESFEDEATAAVMNELYVNIKVDREERPDLDKIYQIAHQLLTQRSGGWPLTMFITPDDHVPFFGGTYFPPSPRFGMPSFTDILTRVAEHYHTRRDDIRKHNTAVLDALRSVEPASEPDEIITPKPLAECRTTLQSTFDARHGGFGGAPKFPHPTNLERLLRAFPGDGGSDRRDAAALEMVTFSLTKMIEGGLYDQLGGGFCRYSVDEQWMIPHFEKMLYDNGPLLGLCADVWQISGEALFADAARDTAHWVMRDMQSPEGGYYSTLDADSEGEEGKFYVWSPDEVREHLTPEEYSAFAPHFGLDRSPNFEGHHWHLHVFRDIETLAADLALEVGAVSALLDRARGKLLEIRNQRIWPARDEKILTSWNALMIKGMATAGRVLEEDRLVASADAALGFLSDKMWRDGRLLATYKDGRARLPAYLDDYAFLIDALLALLQCRWRERDLRFAIELADAVIDHFQDRERGGFYFTADDHEKLIHRSRPLMDDALPAGNGIAAFALGRLGHLLGEGRYLEAAEGAIRAAWSSVRQYPHAHNALLLAAEEYIHPPETIIVRGEGSDLDRWRERCTRDFAPRRLTVAIPSDAPNLPALLAERTPRGEVTAYRCEGHHCDAPITDFAELEAALTPHEVAAPR